MLTVVLERCEKVAKRAREIGEGGRIVSFSVRYSYNEGGITLDIACFLQAKNAEKCKKKYIGLPAQDLRFQTGGRGRLDRGESVPQSIALSRKGQDVGVVNQAIH
ncbi:hypothetical protein GTHT12_01557 [Geobacillus thermodenitrificans]|nr:hypothetical protein GTHT12_01557 [Geobacillus thermodenitrificans]